MTRSASGFQLPAPCLEPPATFLISCDLFPGSCFLHLEFCFSIET